MTRKKNSSPQGGRYYYNRLKIEQERYIYNRVKTQIQLEIDVLKKSNRRYSEYQLSQRELNLRTKYTNEYLHNRQEIYKRYNIGGVKTMDDLKRMPIERIREYYKREKKIMEGIYDTERKAQWVENYEQALRSANADEETIQAFKELSTTQDIETLSNVLPIINMYYPISDSKYAVDQINEALDSLREDILRLRNVLKEKESTSTRIKLSINKKRNV